MTEKKMITFLRLPQVKQTMGLSRSTIYDQISQGLLPKPIKLGARAVAWPSNEVNTIIEARISGKSKEEIRAIITNLETARRS